ncbi:cytochrome c [Maribacter vaceletii]|uniref:Cytochrome c n=1 Tax=Maribacter vaceletii TaxID=1206816 RepID=A0A495E964_9FLAO|nr:c-type cytochrome [Maribacter vaceletii]RKR13033.1 cytochrome c [Maribacter vaceletii]
MKIFNFLKSRKNIFLLGIIFSVKLCLLSCSSDSASEVIIDKEPEEETVVIKTQPIPFSEQRNGNAEAGKEYLLSGNYMSSGVPYNAFVQGNGEDTSNVLNRTGDNAVIPYDYTAVTASNGVRVVAPNCLNCHSSRINNEYIIGLGSHDSDFTVNRAIQTQTLNVAIPFVYGADSEEWEAYDQFRKSIEAIAPKTITKSRGVNTANKIAEVLVSHRDKNTLAWSNEPYVELPDEVIPTDVPAWWLLKKKNAIFYNAMGRLDFCKSMIGASMLTLTDVTKAAELDENTVDVLAYIETLEAPKYPEAINEQLATTGKELFNGTCATCHGTYGENGAYPNLLVALESVETDPELSNHYTTVTEESTYFFDWFNTGWFGSTTDPLILTPEGGYIAPPLDGIWATAPYLHNASVPTLEDMLHSKERPKFWKRTFNTNDYDYVKLGWNYTVESSQTDKNTYDTTLKGYGNGGHRFGDKFSDEERKAVLEYLKTL